MAYVPRTTFAPGQGTFAANLNAEFSYLYDLQNAEQTTGGDDTGKLTTAFGSGNKRVNLGPGTFNFTTLSIPSGLTLKGAGKYATVLKTSGPSVAQSTLLNGGSNTNVLVEDLTIDGNDHANAALGVAFNSSGVFKNVTFRNVRFRNFTTTNGVTAIGQGCGFYAWTADGVTLENCEFEDCNYGAFLDNPGPATLVRGNLFWANPAVTSVLGGITLKYNSTTYAGSIVQGNTVKNSKADPGGLGAYGHGINIVQSRGVNVIGNSVDDCTSAGIHVGSGSYGTKVVGNSIRNCAQTQSSPIYAEVNIGTPTTTIGTDGRQAGVVIEDNSIDTSVSYGVALSYSAGSVVRGNNITNCGHEAIFCDSDRCIISENVCYNNWTSNGAVSPTSTPNVQAQIRVTTGTKCRIHGNQVFDTTGAAIKPDYAIAVADNGHVITENIMTTGYLTAGLFQQASTTNVVANNVN